MNINKKYASASMMALGVLVGSSLLANHAFADTTATTTTAATTNVSTGVNTPGMHMGGFMGGRGRGMMANGVFGTVTAIDGNTLTVSSKSMPFGGAAATTTTPTTTVYTVDATNAKIDKNQASITVSGIAVGDTIMAEGTKSGTTLTATSIHDGVMMKGGMKGGMGGKMLALLMPQGNGQPVVGGTVTAVSGNTITITNKSNVSYTIDATSATFIKNGAAGTLSSVVVGDNVVVQGTVSGTSITAASVTDQGIAQTTGTAGATTQPKGFLGSIGGFFSHLFGF